LQLSGVPGGCTLQPLSHAIFDAVIPFWHWYSEFASPAPSDAPQYAPFPEPAFAHGSAAGCTQLPPSHPFGHPATWVLIPPEHVYTLL